MLKRNKTQIIWSVVLCLLPIALGLCIWNLLPEQIPVHWNMAGEVDRFGSRAEAVLLVPGIVLVCHLLCVAVTAMDPKHQNVEGKLLRLVYWICPVISVVVCGAMYAVALGAKLRVEMLVMVLVGLLFVLIGNWLPKCKPNYTVGIKLPWTLHSEDNWKKTHRMAGPIWIAGGFLMMLSAFLGKAAIWVLLPVLALMVLIPLIYSYRLYKLNRE